MMQGVSANFHGPNENLKLTTEVNIDIRHGLEGQLVSSTDVSFTFQSLCFMDE
jgi:hypothetical protein